MPSVAFIIGRSSKGKVIKMYTLICAICGSEFEAKSPQAKMCSKECKLIRCREYKKKYMQNPINRAHKRERDRTRMLTKHHEQNERIGTLQICERCGSEYIAKQQRSRFCSRYCQSMESEDKRNLLKKSTSEGSSISIQKITLKNLYERDKGICYICGGICDYSDYKWSDRNRIVGKKYPSIDHVIPLSKGGMHSWDNVKLAHKQCNNLKGTKILLGDG